MMFFCGGIEAPSFVILINELPPKNYKQITGIIFMQIIPPYSQQTNTLVQKTVFTITWMQLRNGA